MIHHYPTLPIVYNGVQVDMEPKKEKGQNNLKTWIILLLSFGAAIAAVIFIARNQAQVEVFIASLGPAGPFFIILLYILLSASPIPADSLTLINGALFGPLWGALIAWVGITLSALVEYFIGTRIGSAVDFKERLDDLPFGLGKLPVDSVWFLLGGRMLTGAGSKIVSYLSGIYRVPLFRYIWTTALATLFGAVIFALGGFGLFNLF